MMAWVIRDVAGKPQNQLLALFLGFLILPSALLLVAAPFESAEKVFSLPNLSLS